MFYVFLYKFIDSNARYCGEGIRNMGGKGGRSSLARATVLPGAPMAAVLQSVKGTVANLKQRDVCIVVGGTNDLNDQSIAAVEKKLAELEHAIDSAGNLVFVETHCIPAKDKLNEKILKQNDVIKKFCAKNDIAYLKFNSMLDSHCYARDKYHLNRKGKGILCKLITNHLTSLDVEIPMLKTQDPPVVSKNLTQTNVVKNT